MDEKRKTSTQKIEEIYGLMQKILKDNGAPWYKRLLFRAAVAFLRLFMRV